MFKAAESERRLGQHVDDFNELSQVHSVSQRPLLFPHYHLEATFLFPILHCLILFNLLVHSRLEWTVAQWNSFQENKNQLQQWMESVEQEVGLTLPQQPGLKEKSTLLERLRAIHTDVDAHTSALSRLTDKAVELYEKTGDQTFGPEPRAELNAHFADIAAVVKVIQICTYVHIGIRIYITLNFQLLLCPLFFHKHLFLSSKLYLFCLFHFKG